MSEHQWPDTAHSASPWTALASPSATGPVHLAFRDASDRHALGLQLARWRAALARVSADVVVRPEMINVGGLPVLAYPSPVAVGDNLPTPYTLADTLSRLASVADALDALHECGMVHGALAHHSLWWSQDGRVRFPDAGLANVLDGIVAGSADATPYRAPELWHGQPRTEFSDQYSLAVIAYEWMTGHLREVDRLLEGVTALEPIMLEPAALGAAGVPLVLADVLQRAMSYTPTARFESCREFVNALEAHAASIPVSEPAQREHERRRKRRGLYMPDGATIARTAGAFVVVVLLLSNREQVQRAASLSWLQGLVPKTRVRVNSREGPSQPTLAPGELLRSVLPDQVRDRPTTAARVEMPRRAENSSAPPVLQRGRLTPPELPSILIDVPDPTLDAARLFGPSRDDRAPTPRGQGVAAARGTGSPLAASSPASQPLRTPLLVIGQSRGAGSAAAANGGAVAGATETSRRIDSKVRAILMLSVSPDSRVYVDGILARNSALVEVVPGSHDITVLTGGTTLQRRVSLAAGDTVSVRLVVP